MFITHAAIMYSNGDIVEGRDYYTISSLAQRLGISGERIRGFIASSGDFMLPSEAAIIATKAGQLKTAVAELAPDDLWPTLQID